MNKVGRPKIQFGAIDTPTRMLEGIKEFWKKNHHPPSLVELGKSLGLDPAGLYRFSLIMKKQGVLRQSKWLVPVGMTIEFDDSLILKKAGLK